jgi:hypothetical protein
LSHRTLLLKLLNGGYDFRVWRLDNLFLGEIVNPSCAFRRQPTLKEPSQLLKAKLFKRPELNQSRKIIDSYESNGLWRVDSCRFPTVIVNFGRNRASGGKISTDNYGVMALVVVAMAHDR